MQNMNGQDDSKHILLLKKSMCPERHAHASRTVILRVATLRPASSRPQCHTIAGQHHTCHAQHTSSIPPTNIPSSQLQTPPCQVTHDNHARRVYPKKVRENCLLRRKRSPIFQHCEHHDRDTTILISTPSFAQYHT